MTPLNLLRHVMSPQLKCEMGCPILSGDFCKRTRVRTLILPVGGKKFFEIGVHPLGLGSGLDLTYFKVF